MLIFAALRHTCTCLNCKLMSYSRKNLWIWPIKLPPNQPTICTDQNRLHTIRIELTECKFYSYSYDMIKLFLIEWKFDAKLYTFAHFLLTTELNLFPTRSIWSESQNIICDIFMAFRFQYNWNFMIGSSFPLIWQNCSWLSKNSRQNPFAHFCLHPNLNLNG